MVSNLINNSQIKNGINNTAEVEVEEEGVIIKVEEDKKDIKEVETIIQIIKIIDLIKMLIKTKFQLIK